MRHGLNYTWLRAAYGYARGAEEKKKMKATYIWQMINQVGTYFFYFSILFWAFLCVSHQGEFKNTKKNFLGEVHVRSFWPKKLRKKQLFPFRLFPSIFVYGVFGRFSA
jgi:hypothetical protein